MCFMIDQSGVIRVVYARSIAGISMRVSLFGLFPHRTSFMNPLAKLIKPDLPTFISNILFNILLYACMHILITFNAHPEMGSLLGDGNTGSSTSLQDTPLWDLSHSEIRLCCRDFPSQTLGFAAPLMEFSSLERECKPDSVVGIFPLGSSTP